MLMHAQLKLFFVAVMAFGNFAPSAFAQTSAQVAATASAATDAAAVAPVATETSDFKPILFEVVSIRPFKGDGTRPRGFTDDGFSDEGQRPLVLIMGICATCKQRIEGLPDWARNEEYTIEARVADADMARWKTLNVKQRELAMQAMLEDRFKMKSHHETRVMAGFALVVAKNGPKFKESIPGDLYPGGLKGVNGGPWLGIVETGPGVETGQHVSMEELADYLSMMERRPVTDQTGLRGFYDFKFTVETPDPSTTTDSAMPDWTSIAAMILEQLGLKLESGVKVPVEYLVVDHIERPTEN
jgi:uncharacterized protein (TIGR03435 family)